MEVDSQLNLYNVNQEGYKAEPIMDMLQINKSLDEVAEWILKENKDYYILLCNECRYYTVFKNESKDLKTITKEIKETIFNINKRFISIELNDYGAYEIWLKDDDDEANMYVLFNYEYGVVNI